MRTFSLVLISMFALPAVGKLSDPKAEPAVRRLVSNRYIDLYRALQTYGDLSAEAKADPSLRDTRRALDQVREAVRKIEGHREEESLPLDPNATDAELVKALGRVKVAGGWCPGSVQGVVLVYSKSGALLEMIDVIDKSKINAIKMKALSDHDGDCEIFSTIYSHPAPASK